jgi:hypothetical protein
MDLDYRFQQFQRSASNSQLKSTTDSGDNFDDIALSACPNLKSQLQVATDFLRVTISMMKRILVV